MKVYFIPGLAADKRVFKYIELPGGYEPVYLDWIPPEPDETLEHYSRRMAESINGKEPFILIGLSLGGMIGCEISRLYHPDKLILISSITDSKEIPGYYRLFQKLNVHKVIPASLIKSASIIKRIFTPETPEVKELLRKIIRESDPDFIRWALGAILHWKGERPDVPLYHIHGTTDEILPLKYTSPQFTIEKGTHLMVLSKAKEVNDVLKNILDGNGSR